MDFDEWLESLTFEQVSAILQKYYADIINNCDCDGCEEQRKINAAIQFHIDSILEHDDIDNAKLSLEILTGYNKKLITKRIKKRCKELGI